MSDAAGVQSLVGLTGRAALLAGWVQQAWHDIQNARPSWRWMQAEWEGVLNAGTARYSAADLGISRFGGWLHYNEDFKPYTTLYPVASGQSEEARIIHLPWSQFYTRFLRGSSESARPGWYTVASDGRLVFAPTPDAAYVARGLYRLAPQELAADGDVPELPGEFHDVIWRGALVMLATYDEAGAQYPVWELTYRRRMGELEGAQLPFTTLSPEPLA